MFLRQVYQTTIYSSDGTAAATALVIPSRSVLKKDVLNGPDYVCEKLRFTRIAQIESLTGLPALLAVTLEAEGEGEAKDLLDKIRRENTAVLGKMFGPDLSLFAEQLAYGELIPFERSALSFSSIASIITGHPSLLSVGAAIGLVACFGHPFALITVPVGIILVGAANRIADLINRGEFRERLQSFCNEK